MCVRSRRCSCGVGTAVPRRRQRLDSLRVVAGFQLSISGRFWVSTEACAGEPGTPSSKRFRMRVYPRVCGGAEYPPPYDPPLGSIPACAGEPIQNHVRDCCNGVYPRVCGGASVARIRTIKPEGLSPRVRGSPGATIYRSWHSGSIPACAGEPKRGSASRPPARVYPRVCGGAMSMQDAVIQDVGLSPRVRGSHHYSQHHVRGQGSIPACAGEPRC